MTGLYCGVVGFGLPLPQKVVQLKGQPGGSRQQFGACLATANSSVNRHDRVAQVRRRNGGRRQEALCVAWARWFQRSLEEACLAWSCCSAWNHWKQLGLLIMLVN